MADWVTRFIVHDGNHVHREYSDMGTYKTKEEYFEQYKSAAWQATRLKVLERDVWTCRFCGGSPLLDRDDVSGGFDPDSKISFHIHHTYYVSSAKPWEYPLDSLIALCSDCHERETEQLKDFSHDAIQSMKIAGFTADDIEALAKGFQSLKRQYIIGGCPFGYGEFFQWCCKHYSELYELFSLTQFSKTELDLTESLGRASKQRQEEMKRSRISLKNSMDAKANE